MRQASLLGGQVVAREEVEGPGGGDLVDRPLGLAAHRPMEDQGASHGGTALARVGNSSEIACRSRHAEHSLGKIVVEGMPLGVLEVDLGLALYVLDVELHRIGGVAQVAAGGVHTCVLLDDGTVACWGANHYGQLGRPTVENCSTPSGDRPCSAAPLPVVGISNVSSVSAGNGLTCVTLKDSTAKCWGLNSDGQLGDASTDTCTVSGAGKYACNPNPTQVLGLINATAIDGSGHGCALLTSGSVQCWGGNASGQVGNGTVSTTAALATVCGF